MLIVLRVPNRPKPWTPSPAGIMSRSLFARIANARSLAAIAMKPMLTKGRAWRLGRTRLWIGPKRKNESPRASDAKLRHRLLAMVRVQHRASSIRLKNPRILRGCCSASRRVIAGLDPAIHDESQQRNQYCLCMAHLIMDARVKPAHDAECVVPPLSSSWPGLVRPSMSLILPSPKDVDARHKAGHDDGEATRFNAMAGSSRLSTSLAKESRGCLA